MRYAGRVSANKAAKILGVDRKTVLSMCRAACEGSPTKLKSVERDPLNGYYWIDLQEVQALSKRTL